MTGWPTVVVDIGSGYTKMGYAGNIQPLFVTPTAVANSARLAHTVHMSQGQGLGMTHTDFYIGEEAYQREKHGYLLSHPVVRGRIENWDDVERFMQDAIFRNLRCTPEEHNFLLTEAPFNTPENRELTAEIMFETFNVRGLHIAVQAVLALYAQWVNEVKVEQGDGCAASPDLTGIVVDSGDGLTHIIPVADGFVVNSCVQEIPLAGRHITQFVHDRLTERREPVPPEQRMEAARQIKEQHAYVCKDVDEERRKFDCDPRKFKTLSGVHPKTKESWSVQVRYERFMAPEILFKPPQDCPARPLPEVVDKCIMNCPIDYRRRLYDNVVLAGGSTTFLHFKERLQHDLQNVVDARLREVAINSGFSPQPIPVRVHGGQKRKQQLYAAWLGGSILAQEPNFQSLIKTKQEYDEVGPSCMRGSPLLWG